MQSTELQQSEIVQGAAGDTWNAFGRAIPEEVVEALRVYADGSTFSFDSIVMGAWCHLMSCYSATEEVEVSIAAESGLKQLRIAASGDGTVRDLLGRVDEALRNGLADERKAVDTPGEQPVFGDVVLQADSHAGSFSITFDSLRVSMDAVEMLATCLVDILRELPLHGDREITALPFVSRATLMKYCGPAHNISKVEANVCIHQQIEEQSRRTPGRICGISDSGQIDFRTLNRQANQLARYLRSRGCGPDKLVAVHLDRSIDLLVVLLAVLKAGAAFLPLDAALAEGRVQSVIEDSKASLIVTRSRWARRFEQWSELVICVDADGSEWQGEAGTDFQSPARPENLAYVTYTSGSTGKPKGVMIEHRNLAAYSAANDQVLGNTPGVFLATTNISLDLAVVELLWSLSRGFKVILHAGDEGLPVVSGPRSISAQILEHGVTHVQGTPSLMRLMLTDASAAEALGKVQQVLAGGEAFPSALAAALLAIGPGEIVNLYGPTETTVVSTCHVIRRLEAVIPIGKPLLNTLCYVQDKQGRLVPPMASGELFIGGSSVGRGYLHRPDLTAERFQRNPFDTASNGRMYKTGDLVRIRLDGDLEFIERVDLQVKIRGYRIELGEIEAVIDKFPNIRSSTVVVRQRGSGEKSLAGYYLQAGAEDVDPAALREYLTHLLPGYMVPPVLQQVDAFPLTSNGKVDRAQLAQTKCREVDVDAALADAPDPKMKAAEEVLCSLCSELLKLPAVGPLEDFFQIGGESVIAAQMAQRIAARFGRSLRLSEFVKARNMRALAQVVCQAEEQQQAWSPVVSLRKGRKVPVFFVSGLGGNAVNFEFLTRFLPGRPIYGIETHGLDQNGQALLSIEEMARFYLRAMREAEPKGPYHIVGYSFGGTVAFEMAQQLRASGQTVGVLGLLDTPEWRHAQEATASLILRERLNLLYGSTVKQLVFGPNRGETLRKRMKATFEHHKLSVYARMGRRAASPAASTEHRNYYALTHYVPKPYGGEIQLFRCRDQSIPGMDPALGWSPLCQKVVVSDLAGEHERIFSDGAAVESLGSQLCRLLDQSDVEVRRPREAVSQAA